MKKILFLISSLLLLNGCAESIALIGTSTSNGKIIQSSLNSAISYGVKKQTGKSPLEHAKAYVDKKNPEKKRDTCISFIEKTRSEFCTVVKKKISLTNTELARKPLEVIQKFTKIDKVKKTSLIEKIAKNSVIYNRR
tara:strand:- start:388 stop:798 length:411 start_codon:yes stop_codon:yes gene_type:complete